MPPVVPDCDRPDHCHTPPGPAPAAFVYTYYSEHCLWPCPPEHGMTLCESCCALTLETVRQGMPGTWFPAPSNLRVIRDANTGEPVIPARTLPGGPVIPRFAVVMTDAHLFPPAARVLVILDCPL